MNVLCPGLYAIQTGILQGASERGTLDIVFLQRTEITSQLLTNKRGEGAYFRKGLYSECYGIQDIINICFVFKTQSFY